MRYLSLFSLIASILLFSCSGGGGDEENSFQAYEDAYEAYMSGEKSAEEVMDEVLEFVESHEQEEVGYLFLAHLQTETGQLQKAMTSYRKALEINTKSSTAYNGVGYVYLIQNELDSAIVYLDLALKNNSKDPYSEANKAVCVLLKGDTSRSIQLINASLGKEHNGHNTAVALLMKAAMPGTEVADISMEEAAKVNEEFETAAFRAVEAGTGFEGWFGQMLN
jgi:Tfp pilus assembly protein PilF